MKKIFFGLSFALISGGVAIYLLCGIQTAQATLPTCSSFSSPKLLAPSELYECSCPSGQYCSAKINTGDFNSQPEFKVWLSSPSQCKTYWDGPVVWTADHDKFDIGMGGVSSGACSHTVSYTYTYVTNKKIWASVTGVSAANIKFYASETGITCTSHSTKKCYNNSIYWYNSCDTREEMYEYCSIGETCGTVDGQLQCIAPCSNDCSSSGAKECSGSTGYRTCGNYDSDSCLEWSGVTSCASDKICSNGSCITAPCNNDCSPSGTKECSGLGYKTCGNYDSDSCLEWSTVTNCSSDKECQSGACVTKAPEVISLIFNQDWVSGMLATVWQQYVEYNFTVIIPSGVSKVSLTTTGSSCGSPRIVGCGSSSCEQTVTPGQTLNFKAGCWTTDIRYDWGYLNVKVKAAVTKKTNGSSCTYSSECLSNYCVHSVCRSSATYCGDSYCDSGESYSSCSADCDAPLKANGSSCTASSQCVGYCVHNICRSETSYCGDGYCDSTLESCYYCATDCGACVSTNKSNGASCSSDSNCASNNCVHSVCRSSATYCGDSYCDSGESYSSCSADCDAPLKANGSSCTASSQCVGYCVHNICRSASSYCGDNYCDSGETCSSCSTDCGSCVAPKSDNGILCQSSFDCKSGYCGKNGICCNQGEYCCRKDGSSGCPMTLRCDTSSHLCVGLDHGVGGYCYDESSCKNGLYCVHNTCRSTKIHCGDNYCDDNEKCSCSDCASKTRCQQQTSTNIELSSTIVITSSKGASETIRMVYPADYWWEQIKKTPLTQATMDTMSSDFKKQLENLGFDINSVKTSKDETKRRITMKISYGKYVVDGGSVSASYKGKEVVRITKDNIIGGGKKVCELSGFKANVTGSWVVIHYNMESGGMTFKNSKTYSLPSRAINVKVDKANCLISYNLSAEETTEKTAGQEASPASAGTEQEPVQLAEVEKIPDLKVSFSSQTKALKVGEQGDFDIIFNNQGEGAAKNVHYFIIVDKPEIIEVTGLEKSLGEVASLKDIKNNIKIKAKSPGTAYIMFHIKGDNLGSKAKFIKVDVDDALALDVPESIYLLPGELRELSVFLINQIDQTVEVKFLSISNSNSSVLSIETGSTLIQNKNIKPDQLISTESQNLLTAINPRPKIKAKSEGLSELVFKLSYFIGGKEKIIEKKVKAKVGQGAFGARAELNFEILPPTLAVERGEAREVKLVLKNTGSKIIKRGKIIIEKPGSAPFEVTKEVKIENYIEPGKEAVAKIEVIGHSQLSVAQEEQAKKGEEFAVGDKIIFKGQYTTIDDLEFSFQDEMQISLVENRKQCNSQDGQCIKAVDCLMTLSNSMGCALEFADIIPYLDKPVAVVLATADACEISDRYQSGDSIGAAISALLMASDVADNAGEAVPVAGNVASMLADIVEGAADCTEGFVHDAVDKYCSGGDGKGYSGCASKIIEAFALETGRWKTAKAAKRYVIAVVGSPVTIAVVDDNGKELTPSDGVLVMQQDDLKLAFIRNPEKLTDGYNFKIAGFDNGEYNLHLALVDDGQIIEKKDIVNQPIEADEIVEIPMLVQAEKNQPINLLIGQEADELKEKQKMNKYILWSTGAVFLLLAVGVIIYWIRKKKLFHN